MVNVQPVTFKDNLVPFNFLGQSPRSALVGSLFSFLCSQQFLHHRRISFCTGLWPLLWVLFLLIAKPYSDLGISRLHMYLRTLTACGRHIPAFVLCKSFFWLPITQFLAVLPHSAALQQWGQPSAAVFPTNPGLSTALITAAEHHRWSVHSSVCVLLLQTLQVFYVFSPERMFF